MCESTKSASFVITMRLSRNESSTIAASDVRFASGRSSVWIASCHARAATRPCDAGVARRRRSSCRERLDALHPNNPGGVVQHRKDVLRLQILIVIEDLGMTHSGAEQFQDRLDRVAQPANRRLP